MLHFLLTCVENGDRQHTVKHELTRIRKSENNIFSFIHYHSGVETLYTKSCKCKLSRLHTDDYEEGKSERIVCLLNVKTMQSKTYRAHSSICQLSNFLLHYYLRCITPTFERNFQLMASTIWSRSK